MGSKANDVLVGFVKNYVNLCEVAHVSKLYYTLSMHMILVSLASPHSKMSGLSFLIAF